MMIKKITPLVGIPSFFPLTKFFLCSTAISLLLKGFVPRMWYITILITFVILSSTLSATSSLSSLSSTSLAPSTSSSSSLSSSSSSSLSSSQSQKLVCIYTCVCLLYIPDNSSAVGSLHFLHCIFQL